MSVVPARISDEARARLSSIIGDPRLAALQRALESFEGSEAFLVGGAVRDAILGRSVPVDLDVVVRGVSLEALAEALGQQGSVNFVGKTFGVLKFGLMGTIGDVDIAWPRTERAGMSGGYRDFAVQSDPELPIERDLARRDFTVNALAYRLGDGELTDAFGGLADLEARVLRAVGDVRLRFVEDHSRMLRGIRFACQLGFSLAPETWNAIVERMPHLDDVRLGESGVDERVVPYEIVAKELVKAFAADPARAAQLLHDSGALALLFPETRSMAHCEQSPDHHSEGNVWQHTMLALSKLREPAFAAFFAGGAGAAQGSAVLGTDTAPNAETALAVLLHDIAKPECAEVREGKITFYGHDHRGGDIARAIGQRLRLASAGVDVERLAWLVKMHLFPNMVDLTSVRKTTLEKHFMTDAVGGRELLHLAYADAAAAVRPDGSVDLETLRALLVALREVGERRAPEGKSLLSGEQVMQDLHLSPGPDVGAILLALKEAQLRGEIADVEQARAFIKSHGVSAQDANSQSAAG